jgi:acetyltransferase-like isoleucine patch superfamily enzyme
MLQKKLLQLWRRVTFSNIYRIKGKNQIQFRCNAKKTWMYVFGTNNRILVDDSVETYDLRIAVLGNNNTLIIKKEAFVSGVIELKGDGNTVSIGENTGCGHATILAHYGTKITIGDDCLFSNEIQIRTTDSHSILDEHGKRINPEKDVFISDRVWLGTGVTVLKGSFIGTDVVVGAKSMVSKSIPNNTVAAGIPARVVKENTTWSWDVL